MTREEQLYFCKRCSNRKMDMNKGIICSLTGDVATFTEKCYDFNFDEKAEVIDDPSKIVLHSERILSEWRQEQDYKAAVTAGFLAGILGAFLWGLITVATKFQIGYMALAIGAGVGFSMRYFGKGVDPIFGYTGAFISVLSCFIGNFLSLIGFYASSEGLGFFETLLMFDYSYFLPAMEEAFSPMDLFFYALAGYEGYKFSFRVED